MFQPLDGNAALEAEDLNLLQSFLEAWCEENAADIRSEAASEVAAGLIAWYQSGVSDRIRLQAMFKDDVVLTDRIDTLLWELSAL
ncbi:hypothetical protein [Pararhizobium gei]|uniref:hypothetical protein n=1 Tax=Pararhizobium gei TaxID=1395951 RepID=UPI0023DCDE82|nr:hypothetical protein [Rhizobium gei]